MSTILEEAINQIKSLPESEQERIALLIIKEISADKSSHRKGILSKLKEIKIQAPEDFSQNIDLYLNGEKNQ